MRELVGRPGAGFLCRRGRGWGQGDQLGPGTDLGRAGGPVGDGNARPTAEPLPVVSSWCAWFLVVVKKNCLLLGGVRVLFSLGALFGELLASESGMICLGKIM